MPFKKRNPRVQLSAKKPHVPLSKKRREQKRQNTKPTSPAKPAQYPKSKPQKRQSTKPTSPVKSSQYPNSKPQKQLTKPTKATNQRSAAASSCQQITDSSLELTSSTEEIELPPLLKKTILGLRLHRHDSVIGLAAGGLPKTSCKLYVKFPRRTRALISQDYLNLALLSSESSSSGAQSLQDQAEIRR